MLTSLEEKLKDQWNILTGFQALLYFLYDMFLLSLNTQSKYSHFK